MKDSSQPQKWLRARAPKNGIVGLGVPGYTTVLGGAMMVSSSNIVSLLLAHGADPYECDISGNDPFMMASMFGLAST